MNILFTGYYFDGYHGSMMHICEIGKYLKSFGHNIYIASCIIDDKIKKYTEELGLNLYYADEIPLDIHYDLIWAYHFPIINYLYQKQIKYDKIICGCLSGFLHPLETPPLFCKNNNIPIFVNSKETKSNLIKEYPVFENKVDILINSVPDEFLLHKKTTYDNSLKKIAIVSNHVPKELLETIRTFKRMKIKVDIFGSEFKHIPVTPELLSDYDLIITIGKTVQYALFMGIPVYNYDYMGGSGYIRLNNIDNEEFYNFSGRSHNRKLSSDDIICEILAYYKDTLLEMDKIQEIARQRYSLSQNINNILAIVENMPNNKLEITEEIKLNLTQNCFLFEQTLNTNKYLKYNKHKYKYIQNVIKLSYFKYRLLANVPFVRKKIIPIKQEYKKLLENIKE